MLRAGRNFDSAVASWRLAARRSSSAAPLATNSSLNLPTKLCTGQEQASPKAQIVRPPGMLSAMLHEVIRVALAAFAVREAMQRLAHPERAFAAGRALAAAFVRVKLAMFASASTMSVESSITMIALEPDMLPGGDERIEIVRQIEHVHLLLDRLCRPGPCA